MAQFGSMTRWAKKFSRAGRYYGDKMLANNAAKWGIIGGGAGLFLASRMSDNSWIRGAGNIAGLAAGGAGAYWGAKRMGWTRGFASRPEFDAAGHGFAKRGALTGSAAKPVAAKLAAPGPTLNQRIGRFFGTAPKGSRIDKTIDEDIQIRPMRASKATRMAGNERRRAATNDLVAQYQARVGL